VKEYTIGAIDDGFVTLVIVIVYAIVSIIIKVESPLYVINIDEELFNWQLNIPVKMEELWVRKHPPFIICLPRNAKIMPD